jgi:hypothetical protein
VSILIAVALTVSRFPALSHDRYLTVVVPTADTGNAPV